MSIDPPCKNEAITFIDVFNIVFFKGEFDQFYIGLQIRGSEPVPVILKGRLSEADPNFFLHVLKRFAIQISEIFAAYGFWIIRVSKIGDGKISKGFNMFGLHPNVA